MKLRVFFVLFLAGSLFASGNVLAKKPLDHFFKKPEFAAFAVSPDGQHIAALAPVNTRMNIVVMDLETRQARVVTGMTDQDISYFQWANNERILFGMDKDGSESFGLFAVNIDGSQSRVLQPPLEAQISSGASVVKVTFILDILDDDKEHILVTNNDRRAAHPDVYKMNIYTGRKNLFMRNPGDVQGYFTDWDGRIVGAGFVDKAESGFMLLNDETGELEEVHRARYDEHSFTPVYLTEDLSEGMVSSRINPDGSPRDKFGIYEYNFKTGEYGDLVFEHDVVDAGGVLLNEKRRAPIGVTYMDGTPEVHWINDEWAAIMAGIDQALPDTFNAITSMDDDETVGIVAASSSTQPVVYYLYKFNENSLEFLAESRPWVKPEEMAEMRPIEFKARDGMTMHGYLTIPAGSDGKNLPIVVNPHGGPHARDAWGYNAEHQFLADRGYAVIMVNFRGSTGYGMDHFMASKRQWGQAMQHDVTDALQWAIDEGVADPERACIYGGSYGGYATMAGLTFTPERYKCGINYVGVTDLPLLFKTAPDRWGEMQQWKEMLGDPKTEREYLEEWSPSNHADKIQAPVFMAYGLTDPRVNIRHQRVMESAMKKADVDYETMIKTDEGHGFRKQENIYDFYGTMDTFLAEHLNP